MSFTIYLIYSPFTLSAPFWGMPILPPVNSLFILLSYLERTLTETSGERARISQLECRDNAGNEAGSTGPQRHPHKSVSQASSSRFVRYSSCVTLSSGLRHILTVSNVDKVDETMDSIREQMDLTNEISDAISNPVNMGHGVDEVSFIGGTAQEKSFLNLELWLTDRTSSRPSWKPSSRRSWTTVSPEQSAHLCMRPYHQLESRRAESVSILYF